MLSMLGDNLGLYVLIYSPTPCDPLETSLISQLYAGFSIGGWGVGVGVLPNKTFGLPTPQKIRPCPENCSKNNRKP